MSEPKSDGSQPKYDNGMTDDPDECGICYQTFTNTTAQSVCDTPGHYFHNDCLRKFYQMRPNNEDTQRSRCPLCQNVAKNITPKIRNIVTQSAYDDNRRIGILNQYPFTLETIPRDNGELLTQQELFSRFRNNPPPIGTTIRIYEIPLNTIPGAPRYKLASEMVTDAYSYSDASASDESGNFFPATIGSDIMEGRNNNNMYLILPPIQRSWFQMPSILGKRKGGKTKRKRRSKSMNHRKKTSRSGNKLKNKLKNKSKRK
jgi:hypothetical protein